MVDTAGYSGTPLGRKLGLKPGMAVRLLLGIGADGAAAAAYWRRFGPEVDPGSLRLLGADAAEPADFTHLFARTRQGLREGLALSRRGMSRDGMVWVSWPKQSSTLTSEIGRSEVMADGHAAGLVDVKVCAVDDDWSGLKFVIPVADRR